MNTQKNTNLNKDILHPLIEFDVNKCITINLDHFCHFSVCIQVMHLTYTMFQIRLNVNYSRYLKIAYDNVKLRLCMFQ